MGGGEWVYDVVRTHTPEPGDLMRYFYYSDRFVIPLPPDHRFPIGKYHLLRERVVAGGLVPPGVLVEPDAASDAELALVHEAGYVRRVRDGLLTDKEIRRTGFPWSPALVERARRSVGGTLAACRAALDDGRAANLAGGTHHAFPDHGEGYCIFNDVAVAARAMQREGRARRVLIVDCDVHQGNGTAAIFAADDSVFTFSIHGAKNFPFHKQRSDLDVELPDGTGDEPYLAALEAGLRPALERARADFAIYLAGADPYAGDRLGRMALTKPGLAARDRLVFSRLADAGLPVAITMAGGYARDVQDIVDIHFQTLAIASGL